MRQVLLVSILTILSSCFEKEISPNEWIDKEYPINSNFNKNMALKQLTQYYESTLKINLKSSDSLEKIKASFIQAAKANECVFYSFRGERNKYVKIGKVRGRLRPLIFNTKKKLKHFLSIDKKYAGYSWTAYKSEKQKEACNFEVIEN